ncbi:MULTISPECIES: sigma-70 family RNA polymerase sigma factor [unclassified Streptococcus]|uniref:sigma-70 family RNA polymerase sigma factor n=1 Tax=unclassified Streptococcus TaxID=2608887 RepID=UPI0011B4FE4B|nr:MULTISPECIES: sigma-70 family RNA polymerase sigma factor [unclassified Streptococcus]TWS94846.1 sigma-70 family RNA polymerase sigma factor [Streptococcus sp. sy018]TWT16260.1 sigma-70 family RNA polymerase sigma factor [Streptococcus sp. sy010]
MSKVTERRHQKIIEAANNKDWKTVSHLLNQPLDNLKRQDRKYHLLSLDATIERLGRPTNIIDMYSDYRHEPLKYLLLKEQNERICRALSTLSIDDLHIVIEIAIYNTSTLQLTKETRFKSHKTVKSHYQKALNVLKQELKDYF